MTLHNKVVLVTGGAGFIGSHLVDRIVREEPERLIVVDDLSLGKKENLSQARSYDDLMLRWFDACDEVELRKLLTVEGVDVVFNLAILPLPRSLKEPVKTFSTNTALTSVLCEAHRLGLFDLLVHFSSSEVYGSALEVPMREVHPLNPQTPYAASKAACDHLVLSYVETFGLDSVIVRPFNNFGPRQNEGSYAGVIPATLKHIRSGERPVIFGDGEQTRDYVFVRDTADAAVRLSQCGKARGRVVNVASGRETTVNFLVGMLCELTGWSGGVVHEAARFGDVRRHCGSMALADGLIGFKAGTGLRKGLVETVAWYGEQEKEARK